MTIFLLIVLFGLFASVVMMAASAEVTDLGGSLGQAAHYEYPQKGSTTIYKGAAVGVLTSSGYAQPMADTANLSFMGIAKATTINSGADAAINALVVPPGTIVTHEFDASSAAITWVGQLVYFVDDRTVALVGTTSNDKLAGVCVAFISATKVVVDLTRTAV